MAIQPTDDLDPHRKRLLVGYTAALHAANGRTAVRRYLREHPDTPVTHLIAIGKAAAFMAAGAHDVLGDHIGHGLVITKHGHADDVLPDNTPYTIIEASHPVPDQDCLEAGKALHRLITEAGAEACFLLLLSGGASALVELLPAGFGAPELAKVNAFLLGSGYPIEAINRVRKRLSRLKGGRLAGLIAPRPTQMLLISDVPDDDLKVIGSGPMTWHQTSDIEIDDLLLPRWLQSWVDTAPALAAADCFEPISAAIVAHPAAARSAAQAALADSRQPCRIHHDLLQGDAITGGRRIAGELLKQAAGIQIFSSETTVRLPPSPGRGGRCQSLALAAAQALNGCSGVYVLAAGTDGSDGPGLDAGALIDGGTIARGEAHGLNAADCLTNADAGRFLDASGDLIHTGATGTNVMDLIITLKLE